MTYSNEIFIVQCFCKPVFLAMKYLFLQSCTWKVDARFVQCFCKPVFLAMKYLFLQSCTWKVDARFVEFVEKTSYRNAHEKEDFLSSSLSFQFTVNSQRGMFTSHIIFMKLFYQFSLFNK